MTTKNREEIVKCLPDQEEKMKHGRAKPSPKMKKIMPKLFLLEF